ncbi:family 3 encapsulin nanocompartment shell protein [Nonomuraea sediminis]|uniref:family 3 encapsulin nanocompartment shell protein n=1 Tax=Nonomuraea sediminis TaxID=2835864 RepID=UPI001BDCDCE2|nr:family 3 encapsulin nanocompartment shell protein [Nonomuraea sediminis]
MKQSPGQLFAQAYAGDPENAQVSFDYTITEAHEPTKDRPRLTVRNLLRVVPVEGDGARFWTESPPSEEERQAVRDSGVRREAAFRFGMAEAKVQPIRAWVQIPDGLAASPDALATFLDYRLLVRLATAENLALTTALLGHPEIARLPYDTDYAGGILAACDEVEQSGATPHAMIVNPNDYYHRLVGRGGLLAELAEGNGMKVSRNRWIDPGDALVGDISVAARLLDAGRSVIRVAEPPPGTFARPGVAVCAEVYEGVAVHLPGLFYLVTPTTKNKERP